jgi:hypothetical protein
MTRTKDADPTTLIYAGKNASAFKAPGSKFCLIESVVGRHNLPIRLAAHRCRLLYIEQIVSANAAA